MKPVYHIQNVDRTATTKDYQHLAPNEMLVHGIFYTLQGEGPFSGEPAFFIRLAGCNFGAKANGVCLWCDTAFHLDSGKRMSFDQLLHEANFSFPPFYPKAHRPLVVITGGEPTLQRNLPNLVEVLFNEGYRVQIETNGTGRTVIDELIERDQCTVIISPKASRKGYGKLKLEEKHRGVHLKYVVEADSTSNHHTVPEEAIEHRSKGGVVWVSPMAVYKKPYTGEVANAWDPDLLDHKRTSANYAYAAEYCMTYQLRLSIQQHLFCNLA